MFVFEGGKTEYPEKIRTLSVSHEFFFSLIMFFKYCEGLWGLTGKKYKIVFLSYA